MQTEKNSKSGNLEANLCHHSLLNKELTMIGLTKREIECCRWLAHGYSSAKIAEILNLSKRTIDHYVGHAKLRLGCQNRKAVTTFLHALLIGERQKSNRFGGGTNKNGGISGAPSFMASYHG